MKTLKQKLTALETLTPQTKAAIIKALLAAQNVATIVYGRGFPELRKALEELDVIMKVENK